LNQFESNQNVFDLLKILPASNPYIADMSNSTSFAISAEAFAGSLHFIFD